MFNKTRGSELLHLVTVNILANILYTFTTEAALLGSAHTIMQRSSRERMHQSTIVLAIMPLSPAIHSKQMFPLMQVH